MIWRYSDFEATLLFWPVCTPLESVFLLTSQAVNIQTYENWVISRERLYTENCELYCSVLHSDFSSTTSAKKYLISTPVSSCPNFKTHSSLASKFLSSPPCKVKLKIAVTLVGTLEFQQLLSLFFSLVCHFIPPKPCSNSMYIKYQKTIAIVKKAFVYTYIR